MPPCRASSFEQIPTDELREDGKCPTREGKSKFFSMIDDGSTKWSQITTAIQQQASAYELDVLLCKAAKAYIRHPCTRKQHCNA